MAFAFRLSLLVMCFSRSEICCRNLRAGFCVSRCLPRTLSWVSISRKNSSSPPKSLALRGSRKLTVCGVDPSERSESIGPLRSDPPSPREAERNDPGPHTPVVGGWPAFSSPNHSTMWVAHPFALFAKGWGDWCLHYILPQIAKGFKFGPWPAINSQ